MRTVSALLVAMLSIAVWSCGSSASDPPATDSGPDTDTDSDSDSDSDTQDAAPDSGDTDTTPTGQLGEPCWNDHFEESHPNYGYPDCVAGAVCIGDADGAWCTETCSMTGDIETSGPLADWCCGEMSNPCDPVRFWLPEPLSRMCIPRSADLASPCENGETWPSTALHCAPRCDGTTLVSETMCVEYEGDSYCSFQCDPETDPPCGFMEAQFEGGCCEYYMGADWCTPEAHCP